MTPLIPPPPFSLSPPPSFPPSFLAVTSFRSYVLADLRQSLQIDICDLPLGILPGSKLPGITIERGREAGGTQSEKKGTSSGDFGYLYFSFSSVSVSSFLFVYVSVMRKVRIRTIQGFCCANLRSTRNHLGSRNQTSAIRGNKPIDHARKAARPSTSTKPRSIVHAKQFGHSRQRSLDRARKAARPSAAMNPQCHGWLSCFACTIDRGFVVADGRGLALDDCVRIRGLRSKILRWSESVLCA